MEVRSFDSSETGGGRKRASERVRIARSAREKLSLSALVTRHRKAFYQRDGAVFIAASLSTTVFHLAMHPVFLLGPLTTRADLSRYLLIIARSRSKPRLETPGMTRGRSRRGIIRGTITGSEVEEIHLPLRVSKLGRERVAENTSRTKVSLDGSRRLSLFITRSPDAIGLIVGTIARFREDWQLIRLFYGIPRSRTRFPGLSRDSTNSCFGKRPFDNNTTSRNNVHSKVRRVLSPLARALLYRSTADS